jgi:hypothetical protein
VRIRRTNFYFLRNELHAQVDLFDENGTAAAKTRSGVVVSRELKARRFEFGRKFSRVSTLGDDPIQIMVPFELYSLFKIKKPGEYLLVVRVHLYELTPDRTLRPITMPPAKITVKLEPTK